MEKIITNEFISYKSGFLSGKQQIVESFKLGKIINLNKEAEKEDLDNLSFWYDLGYEDGLRWYSNIIFKDSNWYIKREQLNEIILECFGARVQTINEQEDLQIPVFKFRI